MYKIQIDIFKKAIEEWEAPEDANASDYMEHAQDIRDLEEILTDIEAGNLEKASRKANNLPGDVRAEIPDEIWEILE